MLKALLGTIEVLLMAALVASFMISPDVLAAQLPGNYTVHGRAFVEDYLPYEDDAVPRLTQGRHQSAYDFSTECGARLVSPIDGIVTYEGIDPACGEHGCGNTYLFLTGEGVMVMLLHGDYIVRAGQEIRRGQLIGYEASNGNSTGCHTHIRVTKDGVNIGLDPG